MFLVFALPWSCARAPEVKPAPEPRPSLPPVPPGFILKSFQVSMHDGMRKSYDLADEILVGVLAGIRDGNRGGQLYYFEDFSLFDKERFSWGLVTQVIVAVRPDRFRPEIIRGEEFKRLIPLDRIGICWDFYEGKRAVYLVEGQKNLLFLKVDLDEASSESFRSLLDAYPVTPECRAVDVFNLMIHNLFEEEQNLQNP